MVIAIPIGGATPDPQRAAENARRTTQTAARAADVHDRGSTEDLVSAEEHAESGTGSSRSTDPLAGTELPSDASPASTQLTESGAGLSRSTDPLAGTMPGDAPRDSPPDAERTAAGDADVPHRRANPLAGTELPSDASPASTQLTESGTGLSPHADSLAATQLPGNASLGASLATESGTGSPRATVAPTTIPAPDPIFHTIGEPSQRAAPSAVVPAPGSHVEVGVQGRARMSAESPEATCSVGEVRHPGRLLALAAAVAVIIGSGFLIRALTLTDPVPPPVPPAWAGRAVGAVGHRAPPLGYARPTRITVGRVGIHADVLSVGLAGDGEVGVPPAREPLKAAWYDRGPAPGQAGPAVITGHVDSRFAPGNRAAFYELGAVRPGDTVEVARADRRVAVFRVDSVALVPKTGFPTREVYGPTGYAALRLITCGGHYDRRTGYTDNVIVYAHLVGSR